MKTGMGLVLLVSSLCACQGTDGGGSPSDSRVDSDATPDADVTATSDTASGSVDRYEPPIQVVFKIHIEPQGQVESYRKHRDDVEAVRVMATSHGAKLTIHGNGAFWQYAAAEGDNALIESWLSTGHDLGPHMHAVYEDPDGSGTWLNATPAQRANPDFVAAMWADHLRYLQALFPTVSFEQATPYNSLDPGFVDMMASHGFGIVGGGRHEIAGAWFGHDPYHPWQIGSTYLEEDLSSPVVIVPHSAQFGEADAHGPVGSIVFGDQTPGHLKLGFLEIYLNRLYAQRTGEPNDRVWVYGFLTHDNKSPASTRDDIDAWLTWLDDHFVGTSGPDGKPVAAYATFQDVADAYDAWHTAHPGVSSYNVATPTPIDPVDPTAITDAASKAAYPGPFWGLAKQLASNEVGVMDFVDFLSDFDSAGVKAAALEFGPRANPSVRAPRWLLWREDGAGVTIDVSGVVGAATVRQWDVVNGGWSAVDASAVTVDLKPVLIDLTTSPEPR